MASKGGVPAGNVFESYKDMVGEGIPYRKFNYQTLEQFLQSMPDVCRITARGRDIVVVGVANNETHHIGEMVRKQGGKSMGGSKDKKEDKKSRPLQDARIVKCGELIPKKKVQSSEDESSSSSSSEDEEEKIRKKLKKQKKKAKKAAKKAAKKEKEEGEIDEGELHPLVQLSTIDPDSIPDVPANRFLDRAPEHKNDYVDIDRAEGDSSRVVGGKKVKGRGMMMFKKDRSRSRSRGRRSRSRSRDRRRDGGRRQERSVTPPHWRQAERRTISLKEYEKQKKEVARKDQERERREEERKERYLARKAEDERRQREKEKRRAAEEEENTRNEEARRARKFREERRNEESFDHDKLDFDPEDDDENGLRQRALETQSRNLIPNYGSTDRRRYKIFLKLNICDTDTI